MEALQRQEKQVKNRKGMEGEVGKKDIHEELTQIQEIYLEAQLS